MQRKNNQDFTFTESLCRFVHRDEKVIPFKLLKRADGLVNEHEFAYVRSEDLSQRFAQWERDGWEVFMYVGGISSATENWPRSDDITGAWAVAIDLDGDVDIDWWRSHPIRPTYAINTSEGRYHFIWLFSNRLDAQSFTRIAVALAHRLGGDTSFGNATQAVRLPGFINGKYGNRVTGKVSGSSEAPLIYDSELVAAALDVPLILGVLKAGYRGFDEALNVTRSTVPNEDDLARDLESALRFVPADSYDVWVKVLMALSGLPQHGHRLAENWSRTWRDFDQASFDAKWRHVSSQRHVWAVQAATIFYLAQQAGWQNPGTGLAMEGPSGGMTERDLAEKLAGVMSSAYAVLPTPGKIGWKLLMWDGTRCYRGLDQTQARHAVAAEVRRAFASAGSANLPDSVRKLTGTNNALDSLMATTADFMRDQSSARLTNSYPYLPVHNGVLNLLSGQLIPSAWKAVPGGASAVHFDPEAAAPLFASKLVEIFEKDNEMISFFLRLVGYIFLGRPREHKFVVFHGASGRNGKSLLVSVLESLLGSMSCVLQPAAIMVKSTQTDGATPAIAKLRGKRLAVISEPNARQVLDAGLIKQLTGGDRVGARKMYGHEEEFEMEATLLMVTNVLPSLREDDDALWARMLIVPFNRTFSPAEIDSDLKQKLIGESSGILNMVIAGVRDYWKNGLNVPEKCKISSKDQRSEIDPLKAWMDECVELRDGVETVQKELYDCYVDWAAQNKDYRRLNRKEFSARLIKTFQRVEKRNCVYFSGIRLVRPDIRSFA